MTKPKGYTTPGTQTGQNNRRREEERYHDGPEPLSGSKKVKNRNHVSHHNPQG
jgi:small acid-soluble spore protein P (minor)